LTAFYHSRIKGFRIGVHDGGFFKHDVPSYGFAKVFSSKFVYDSRCGRKGDGAPQFHAFYLYRSTFVNAKGFSALTNGFVSYFGLGSHLLPLRPRYEGIDGSSRNRSARRIFYGVLDGVLAICLSFRISYRLFIIGDNRPYGLTWKILAALYFLSNMARFGMVFERIMYFTNPCADRDQPFPYSFEEVHRPLNILRLVA
jgi:hypothetical protein